VAPRPAVLIVEDETLIRLPVVEVVEDAGFEPVQAGNAGEAVALLEARGDIRLVFADVHMPGSMDGLALAHVIRHRWPSVEIIVTSGKVRLLPRDLPQRAKFIPKPYDIRRLAETISEMIVGTNGSRT
jgi:DNA-binding NtrC family response regulator